MHTLDIVHVTNSIPEEGGAVGVSDVPVAVSDVRAMIMLHSSKHLLYTLIIQTCMFNVISYTH